MGIPVDEHWHYYSRIKRLLNDAISCHLNQGELEREGAVPEPSFYQKNEYEDISVNEADKGLGLSIINNIYGK